MRTPLGSTPAPKLATKAKFRFPDPTNETLVAVPVDGTKTTNNKVAVPALVDGAKTTNNKATDRNRGRKQGGSLLEIVLIRGKGLAAVVLAGGVAAILCAIAYRIVHG